jgi:hypothetical protein
MEGENHLGVRFQQFYRSFPDGVECGVDQQVHATAGREAGAPGSRPIGTVHEIGNRLYTIRKTALNRESSGECNAVPPGGRAENSPG